MKKLFLLAAVCGLVPGRSGAQITVTYPATEDAYIWALAGDCVLQGNPPPFGTSTPADVNFGSLAELYYMAWTWRGDGDLDPRQPVGGCQDGTMRTLIRFNDIREIPRCSNIISARIRFYGIPSSSCSWCWNTWPSTAPGLLINNGELRKVTRPWGETAVTWNNFGASSNANVNMSSFLPIQASASNWGWNPAVDVTSFVQDIVDGEVNLGWQLALERETPYRRVAFASREYPDRALRPVLEITYASKASFEYCVNSAPSNTAPFSQLLYHMTANFAAPAGTTYEWSVDNIIVGTGPSADYQVPYQNTGSVNICLRIRDANGDIVCEKCHEACIFKPDTYSGDVLNAASFKICKNTMDPYTAVCTILNPQPGPYVWGAMTYGASAPPQTQTGGLSFTVTSPGLAPVFKAVSLSYNGTPAALNAANICFNTNVAGRPAPEPGVPGDNVALQPTPALHPDDVLAGITSISPNPTSGSWKVVFTAGVQQQSARLNLYDITGKLVSAQERQLHQGTNTAEVSGNNLAPGVYILELSQGNSRIREKVIRIK